MLIRRSERGRAADRLALADLTPRQQLLEGDAARASAPPQLRLEQDRAAANPRGQPRAPCAVRVHAREEAAHERAAAVVTKPTLVLGGTHAMPAEMGIGELAEHPGAEQAANAVLLNGLPRIRAKDREDPCPVENRAAEPASDAVRLTRSAALTSAPPWPRPASGPPRRRATATARSPP